MFLEEPLYIRLMVLIYVIQMKKFKILPDFVCFVNRDIRRNVPMDVKAAIKAEESLYVPGADFQNTVVIKAGRLRR